MPVESDDWLKENEGEEEEGAEGTEGGGGDD